MRDKEQSSAPLDDRSPYMAAVALMRCITQDSDELNTEEKVKHAFAEAVGPGAKEYIDVIARSGHSVFYHQIALLYELGRLRARPELCDSFCFRAGRSFLGLIFADNLAQILQIALASPHEFQQLMTELLTKQIYFYAGDKYRIEPARTKTEVTLSLNYANPTGMSDYLARFGVDVERAFINSFDFIAGAMREFTGRIVAGYEPEKFRLECDGSIGRIHLPIGNTHRFANEAIVPTLVGYISGLKAQQARVLREEHLESGIIAESGLMRDTWALIRRASRSDEIVMLRGESGTGKSFMARKIHEQSHRSDKPFVEVGLTSDLGSENLILSNLFGHERGSFTGAQDRKNGLFSLADGGTIFLDEIGDATPELQAKLLRVLESSTFKRLGGVEDITVDVRIIVATNRDLEAMVKERVFREDLYYRINLITLELPALRDRVDDIPLMAEFLLERAQQRMGSDGVKMLAPGLAQKLRAYHWPGNIRQLEYALKRAMALADSDLITEADLPDEVR
ncbi:MAG: sigma 54-interacting transcriptional regulator, partial [Planctomycetota bacterium]